MSLIDCIPVDSNDVVGSRYNHDLGNLYNCFVGAAHLSRSPKVTINLDAM